MKINARQHATLYVGLVILLISVWTVRMNAMSTALTPYLFGRAVPKISYSIYTPHIPNRLFNESLLFSNYALPDEGKFCWCIDAHISKQWSITKQFYFENAVINNRFNEAYKLLKEGAFIYYQDQDKKDLLQKLIESNNLPAVKWLVDRNALKGRRRNIYIQICLDGIHNALTNKDLSVENKSKLKTYSSILDYICKAEWGCSKGFASLNYNHKVLLYDTIQKDIYTIFEQRYMPFNTRYIQKKWMKMAQGNPDLAKDLKNLYRNVQGANDENGQYFLDSFGQTWDIYGSIYKKFSITPPAFLLDQRKGI